MTEALYNDPAFFRRHRQMRLQNWSGSVPRACWISRLREIGYLDSPGVIGPEETQSNGTVGDYGGVRTAVRRTDVYGHRRRGW
jgi:hypothetical protein